MKIFFSILGCIFLRFWIQHKSISISTLVFLSFYLVLLSLLWSYPLSKFLSLFIMAMVLFVVACQDLETYYFSLRWIFLLPLLLIWIPSKQYDWSWACLIGILTLFSYRREWMGSVDSFCIPLFSFFLGRERSIVALLIACVSAFVWQFYTKEKRIPFIAFLSLGFWFAVFKGYSLWYLWLSLLM